MALRPTILVLATIVLFLAPHLPLGVSGVSYTTSLQTGDQAVYKVQGSYSENVSTTEMVVLSVEGTNLTVSFKDRYIDNDTRVDYFWLHLETGRRNSSNLIFAVATGLVPGDPIPNGPDPAITLDYEGTSLCGAAQRTTNHASYSVTILSGTRVLSAYWDRASGVLCDLSWQDPGGTLSLRMINTNLWLPDPPATPRQADPLPWLLLSVLGIVLLAFVFVIVGRRRRRPTRR